MLSLYTPFYLERISFTVAVQFWDQSHNVDFESLGIFLLSNVIIYSSLFVVMSITTLLFIFKSLVFFSLSLDILFRNVHIR